MTEGAGRKDGATHRLTGRAADNRLVHLAVPGDVVELMAGRSEGDVTADDPRLADDLDPRLPRPGDMVTVVVTRSAPYHLVADSAVGSPGVGGKGTYSVRRTRSGDAWVAREKTRLGGGDDHAHAAPAAGGPVSLGLPSLRRP